jgi:hypothetical protein
VPAAVIAGGSLVQLKRHAAKKRAAAEDAPVGLEVGYAAAVTVDSAVQIAAVVVAAWVVAAAPSEPLAQEVPVAAHRHFHALLRLRR